MYSTKKISCPECKNYGYTCIHSENSISSRICTVCGGSGMVHVPLTGKDILELHLTKVEDIASILAAACKQFSSCNDCPFKNLTCGGGNHKPVSKKAWIDWVENYYPLEED